MEIKTLHWKIKGWSPDLKTVRFVPAKSRHLPEKLAEVASRPASARARYGVGAASLGMRTHGMADTRYNLCMQPACRAGCPEPLTLAGRHSGMLAATCCQASEPPPTVPTATMARLPASVEVESGSLLCTEPSGRPQPLARMRRGRCGRSLRRQSHPADTRSTRERTYGELNELGQVYCANGVDMRGAPLANSTGT